jgi:hypothetical protein
VTKIRPVLILSLMLSPSAASAADFQVDGYVDLRIVKPSDERSWSEGGLGKLRFDTTGDDGVTLRVGEAVVQGQLQIDSDFLAVASLRLEQDQRTPVDALEAYLRYRPVSTSPWRWSVKAGAFFPPISLENDEIGWTSYWTLTPSAINTWVGEELRTIGAEAKVELRGTTDTLEASGAVFGWNDPAGVMLADRGWAMGDRPTGLFDRLRLPDAFAAEIHHPIPVETPLFKEIDDRPGWYANAKWTRLGLGSVQMLYYNNEADPSAKRGQFAWRTAFWSLGAQTTIGDVVLLAQAMTGETEINPSWAYDSLTHFWAAYVLAGWQCDAWRFAARADIFESDQRVHYFTGAGFDTEEGANSEHGNAITLAATWSGEEWLRLTTEALFVHSFRPQRAIAGVDPSSDQFQLQESVRLYF